MKKMSVAQAAEFFGVSKEAIHNRIRRGSIKSVIEDGIKMVMVDDKKIPKPTVNRVRTTVSNDERYYKLLETQNTRLQEKVEKLENETRTLRDQKEQMLIEERRKIELIYKEKDEQLKNILQTISSKFMLNAPFDGEHEEALEAEIALDEEIVSEVISLKKHLKTLEYSEKKIKKIRKRFKENAKKDERIILVGKKYYIDNAKYDYDDLIR